LGFGTGSNGGGGGGGGGGPRDSPADDGVLIADKALKR